MPKVSRSGSSSKPKDTSPLWRGPEVDGVTQSMLSDFLVCRERFRVKYILGFRPAPTFNHKIEYGNMWHICEEWYAKKATSDDWIRALKQYASELCRRYQTQQEQIQHWYNVCKVQFPLYVKYWKKHKDTTKRETIASEHTFKWPYELPNGRMPILRGKFDLVDVEKQRKPVIYLQENKANGDLDEIALKRQLRFDLQTNLYLVVLHEIQAEADKHGAGNFQEGRIAGVRYNCIRRPLSGGKGSIRKHQPTKSNPNGESDEEFYKRLGEVIWEDPGYYFMRWKTEVIESDLNKFRGEFLDPILTQLCEWYDWISKGPGAFCRTWQRGDSSHGIHWRTPYGFYNVLAEGGNTDLDEFLDTGNMLGLERAKSLFTELA